MNFGFPTLVKATCTVAVFGLLGLSGTQAAVISTGNIQLGVNALGNLIDGDVGLNYVGVGDALIPGCFCEGFGVAANGAFSGSANAAYGPDGLDLVSFTTTASTATSVVRLSNLPQLFITHAYAPSPLSPHLFEAKVTIYNSGASAISDLIYRRNQDWDVPPNEFQETVTIGGVGAANLIQSNDNGFLPSDPLFSAEGFYIDSASENAHAEDLGADTDGNDLGALFDFGFGTLGAGEVREFNIFYGAAANEDAAMAALVAVGAEVYSLGQSNVDYAGGTPATYIFGFNGVGGAAVTTPAVPEPSAVGLMGLGLGLMIFLARRKRQ